MSHSKRTFIRRAFTAAAATLMLTASGAAFAGPGHGHDGHGDGHGHAKSFTGEVMDLACYMQHPKDGQGAEHAKCAAQCINKGLPAGLKVGDKLYLLMGKGHDSITEKLAAFAGKQATITGAIIESGGMSTIIVKDIKAAK